MTQQEFNRWVVERLEQLITDEEISSRTRSNNVRMFKIEVENMLRFQINHIGDDLDI